MFKKLTAVHARSGSLPLGLHLILGALIGVTREVQVWWWWRHQLTSKWKPTFADFRPGRVEEIALKNAEIEIGDCAKPCSNSRRVSRTLHGVPSRCGFGNLSRLGHT